MHNFIEKMTLLCLRKFNSDATDYVQSTQPTQTTQTNLYTICYRKIRRHISFFIIPIILSSLIACGGPGGAAPAPASPASAAATPLGFTSLRVTWDSVPQAERYEVYDSNGEKVATIVPPATSYTATGLSPNTEYTYSIKACNSSSCSTSVTSAVTTNGNKNGGDTIINSIAELAAIGVDKDTLAGNYILAADIDLSDIPNWQPIGDSVNGFTGSFDGSGYEISGMTISGYEYAGLFGYVKDASISNLGVKVNSINSSSPHAYAGGLAAHANSSFISNVYVIVASDITSSAESSSYAGGLFGRVDNSRIRNSYVVVRGSISSSFSSGGLVGGSSNSSISNSYYSASRESSEGEFSNSHGTSKTVDELKELTAESTDWDKDTWYFGTVNALPRLSSDFVPDVEPPPVNVPASPRGVTVAPLNSTYIRVSWNSVSDVEFYKVYNNRGGSVNATPNATSYTATDLLPNTGYTYRVAACNESGCSAFTSRSAATLPAPIPTPIPVAIPIPDSPSSISAAGQDFTSVTITWSKVLGAKRYEVYKGDEKVATLDESRTTYIINKDLLPAIEYTYSVKACNDSGCSDSIEVDFTTEPIGISSAPQVIVVDSTIGQVNPSLDVSWNYIRGVTSYQIFDAAENKVATVQSPTTSHIIADLSAGTLYEYKVRGCYTPSVTAPGAPESSEICGELSPVGSATTPVAIPVPSGVTATALGITSLIISWDSVEGAVTYQVNNSGGLVATIDAPATSYTARGLLPTTGYTYSVKACNVYSCSASVSTSATTENGITISSATDLAAIRANSTTLSDAYALTGNIDLSDISNWQPIGNATNKFTGSFNGNGYNISGVSSSGYQYAGLFGYVEDASISNVGVLVDSISSSTTSSYSVSYSGGLVGYAVRSAIINSYAVVEDSISSIYISGGLVGDTFSSVISNSYAVVGGSISSSGSFDSYSGGLVGFARNNSPISNSYAVVEGSISSSSFDSYSGGLVGSADNSPISNSYAVVEGNISSSGSSNSYSGGLVGATRNNSPISKSYYNASRKSLEGEFSNTLGTSQTPAQLRRLTAASTSWNDSIWDFGTNDDLPKLRSLPPSVPASITAAALGLSSIKISWDSVEGAVTYQVHNSEGLVATIETPATSYTATDLLPNTEYTYRVRACNLFGCSDFASASATTMIFRISSATELAAIRTNSTSLARDYALTGNIDLSHIPNWQPIGNLTNKFTGSFNGNGYNISGVSSSGYQYAGLFGYVENANISNVGVLVGNISSSSSSSSGFSSSGGLVGYADESPISNSYAVVEGNISSSGSSSNSGGLVGYADESPISNSYAMVEGSILSSSSGGLVGYAFSSVISNSYAVVEGSISSASLIANSYSGGLVGYADESPISNSYAMVEGNISSSSSSEYSSSNSGGLVGYADESPISNSYAMVEGNISSSSSSEYSSSNSGGLVGYADESPISNSYAVVEGNISSSYYSGGLVGYADESPISNSYAVVKGSILSSYYSGGLVGGAFDNSPISNSYALVEGSISSSSRFSASGGLVGLANNSPISKSYYSISPKPSEGGFSNTLGTSQTPAQLRRLTAASTSWNDSIWDFGTNDDLPQLRSLPPSVPASIAATALGLSSIRISWNSVEGAATYQVHNSDGLVTTIETPATSYTATDLLPNTEYTYRVRACNLFGCSDFASASATTMIFIISSAADLAAIRANNTTLIRNYDLTDNIDLSDIANWQPIGNLTNKFTGSFNGNGYNISGISSSGYQYAGLFGYVENANISNVGVLVGNISSSSSHLSSSSYSGGLVGRARSSRISNSYAVVEGSISSSSSSDTFPSFSNSGGLVGRASDSEISNSYAVVEGSISSSSSSRFSSSSYSGGLVGSAGRSPISNSYAVVEGDISSTSSYSNSGGLVGSAGRSPISNSYAVVEGSISSSSSYSGGLVGYALSSLISNSYYSASRKSSEGAFTNTLGTPQTLAQLRALTAATTDWDEVIWDFGTDANLPTLRSLPSPAAARYPANLGDVTATALSLSSISMSWGSVVGATSYEVYNSSGLVTTIDAPATSYVATGLLPDTQYTYRVRACNLFGCSDFASASATTMIFRINSAAELAAIRTDSNTLARHYALTGNIDLSDISNWQPIGNATNKFTGSFNGNGYNISGVSSSGYQYAGLFGYVRNANISNVGVLVSSISSISTDGSYSGGLVGYADNSPIINSYVEVTGNISSSSSYSYSGGLVGLAQNSPISNSYAVVGGSISSSSSTYSSSGGLVGEVSSSEISNSYAVVEGSISSRAYSGGLIGLVSSSEISNSYALVGGSISSYSYSGGLVGYANANSPISNSYALVEGNISSTGGVSSSGGIVGVAVDSPISNSYAVVGGSISSSSGTHSYSGGLIGYAYETPISNSYALVGGSISSSGSSDSSSGGLVGFVYDSPIIKSYYSASRKSSEGAFTNTLGTPQTPAQLRRLTAAATGWDEGIWDFGTDANLPTLRSLPSPAATRSPANLGDVTATALSLSSISMSWGSVVGATSYEVYNSSGLVTTIDAPATSYAATNLLPDTQYTYRVRACNLFSCSAFAGGVSATTETIGVSSAPQVTVVASTIGRFMPSLKVSWDSIAGVTSYQIVNLAGEEVATVLAPSTEYVVAGLPAGTLYEYQVRGCYDSGVSASPPESSEVCGELSPVGSATTSIFIIAAPSGVTATVLGITSLSISWNSVEGAVTYQVHNSGNLVATIDAPTTSYTTRDLLPNTGYTYSVKACYNSDCSDSVSTSATTENGITISSAVELAAIRANSNTLAGDYALTGNIDLSHIPNWQPIGSNYANRFTGSFDGNGYNISGVSSSGYRFAGLFGYVEGASISNVGVLVGNISLFSYTSAGGLVGYARGSPISNSYAVVEGSISSSSDNSNLGGLVGRADGSPISNSYAVVEGSISSSSSSDFSASGGLVGYAVSSPIINSYALVEGSISSSSRYTSYSGGLVGQAFSSQISNSYAVVGGSVSSSSNYYSYSGGLVGYAENSRISNSYAVVRGDISSSSISDSSNSGGLVGEADESPISNSYAVVEGSISSSSSSFYAAAGGLVGYAEISQISNSYAVVEGSISSSASRFNSYSGGLVGDASNSLIDNSYAVVAGNISSSSSSYSSYSGGLVGSAGSSRISNSYAVVEGNISSSSSSGSSYSGGLVGSAGSSRISNSYAVVEGNISSSSSSGSSYSGGLVGYADNSGINNSYAVVEGGISSSLTSRSYSGGLIGLAQRRSPISNSYYSASHQSSEGEFSNTHGTSQKLAKLRTLTADATGWDAAVWDFGTAANLPTLRSLPSPAATRSPANLGDVTAAALGLTSISISWDSVDKATSYEVYNSGALVSTIEDPATSYTATDLLPDTQYTYRVRACNLFGCSDFASDVSATTMIFRISSAAELAAIRTDSASLARHYDLTGNIDLSDIPNWQPIGNATNKFTGSFDGNGYKISGVSSTGYQFAGLFGYVENADISNVGVLVGNISSSSFSSPYTGGLVGYARLSEISNSYAVVEGSISSSSYSMSYSGGLVGYADDSQISNSYAVVEGDISSSSSFFSSYSGGLVGYAQSSPISNSYAVVGGSISSSLSFSASSGGLAGTAHNSPISNSYAVVGGSISSSNTGGLVGRAAESQISNSYAVVEGSISSSSSHSPNSGGLIGWAENSPISNSYYSASRKPSEGEFTNTLGISRTVAQLRALTAEVTTWDGAVWDFGTDANLPTLRSLPPPAATRYPTNLGDITATALSLSSISMSWGNVVGATSYEVYNSEGLVGSTSHPTTSYAATGLLPDTQYTYRVRACNVFGCSDFASDVSATTDATVGTSSAPQVTLVASTIGRAITSLKVSWDSIAGVTSYQILNRAGEEVATVLTPSTEYVVAGLAAGTLYEYQVRGCYDSGVSASPPEISEVCGELSPVGSATTSRFIPAPSGVTATVLGITSLSISWNSVEGAVTYQVHNSGGLVATIEAPTTSYTARDLLPNTGYTYSVKACNDTGCSASVSASATTENGITISSAAELATIRTNSKTLAGNYALTGNIDLSHIPNWQPIGDSTNVFTGSFDGNGYNISGVSSSGYQHAGLFGYVGNADISNVGVLVGNISSFFSSSSSSSSGRFNSYSGGLVGFAFSSPISNSYAVVEGSISSSSSSSSGSYSGGLVGYASYSPISNSYAFVEGSISSSSSSGSYSGGLVGSALYSVISNSYALVADSISSSGEISSSGGLVGSAFYSVISNSYALVGGNISSTSSSGSSYSGGLVGWAYDRHVSNSYAVVGGNISSTSYSGSSNSGGLVGLASRSISKSYYSASRKSSEGAFSNTHGTSQTPVRLRALTADATGWDEVIWDFGTNNDLPTLRSLPSSDITAILSPASPEDFTATALGLTSLSMSWDSVDGATSYEVYNSSGLVTTIESPATNYVATGLLPEMEYTYRVRACNLFGCSAFASASAMTMVASISSAADLAAIRANSNTLDGDYALTGNIDLSHISNWQPIGGSFANAFTGSFDGNGYNISGVSSSGDEFAGLFGYVDDANISNVGVLIGNILSSSRDTSYSGGLVSYASDSQISNSYAVVEGSISSSTARFNSYSGGLVGYAYSSQISNSYAVVGGNISSSSANYDTYSGGLVGWVSSSEISNSYAVVGGSISSSSPSYSRFYIGGLVGGADDNSPISNSYYSASHQSSEGAFTNTNGTSQTLAELRALTADATTWDEVVWDFGTNNDLPILRSSYSAGIVSPLPLLPDPAPDPDSNNGVGKETNRDTDGDGTPDHVDTDDDDDNYSDALDVDDDGDGLIEIATAEQLNQVRHNLLGGSLKASAGDAGADTGCGGLNGITECNGYELVADISLAGYNSNNWLPIGSCPTFTEANVCTDVSALFNTVFDGNGYTISNLTITNSIESYTNATGLFGAISPASQLRNIHIRSANLIGGANNVGVLVGYAARASIIDSSAVGEITAYGANVGGLVGFGWNTTIISSYAAGGAIVGVSGVGGLIGSGERATISSSYAAGGDVSGTGNSVGGLVGSGERATISLSYAAGGHVVAGFAGGGGLVGSGENARIISSYAAGGNVSGFASIGGLIGSGENATIISSYAAGGHVSAASGGDGLVGSEGVTATDSYWDSDTTGVAAGIYGLPQTTRELQTPTSAAGIYTNWATDECDDGGDAWDFGTASQYPVLSCTPNGVDAQRP